MTTAKGPVIIVPISSHYSKEITTACRELPSLRATQIYYAIMRKRVKYQNVVACSSRDTDTLEGPKCWACYTNIRGRTNAPGHSGFRASPKPKPPWLQETMMKRPSEEQTQSAAACGMPDEMLAKKYPRLCEYLTTDKWEDGTSREPSALSISCRDGGLQLALNDKELKQSLYTSAGSLAEALKLMEGALESGRGEWRPWKTGKRK